MNFNNAFMNNSPLISRPDLKNYKTTIHDNIGDILRNENIIEYIVYINSNNRDLTTNPSQFNFVTIFGGLKKFSNENISGTNEPVIERNFLNVKFIELGYIFIPRTNIIKTVINPDTTITYSLSDNDNHNFNRKRFLILNVKELSSPRIYSTGNPIRDTSFIITRDQGHDEQLWKCCIDNRTFPNSLLKNINKMTIQLCDDEGNEIKLYKTDGTFFDLNNTLLADPNNTSLQLIKKQTQVNIQFTFGCVEAELNTLPKFEG
jgi:hypothetical protein